MQIPQANRRAQATEASQGLSGATTLSSLSQPANRRTQFAIVLRGRSVAGPRPSVVETADAAPRASDEPAKPTTSEPHGPGPDASDLDADVPPERGADPPDRGITPLDRPLSTDWSAPALLTPLPTAATTAPVPLAPLPPAVLERIARLVAASVDHHGNACLEMTIPGTDRRITLTARGQRRVGLSLSGEGGALAECDWNDLAIRLRRRQIQLVHFDA